MIDQLDNPLLALWKEWKRLDAEKEARREDASEMEMIAWSKRRVEIEKQIANHVPLTPESAAVLVQLLIAAPYEGEGEKTLSVLQQAVMANNAVRCQYYAIARDAEEPREIEPYGLYFNWGKWYSVARARDRDALRVFRLDRMRDAKRLTGRDARFDVPDDFSIRSYAGRAPWELSGGEGEKVRVSFRFPDSRWVQNQSVGEVVDPVLEDGGAVLEFAVSDKGPFLRWLLTYRDRAEVLSPDSVRTELTELRRSVAALYKGIGAE